MTNNFSLLVIRFSENLLLAVENTNIRNDCVLAKIKADCLLLNLKLKTIPEY